MWSKLYVRMAKGKASRSALCLCYRPVIVMRVEHLQFLLSLLVPLLHYGGRWSNFYFFLLSQAFSSWNNGDPHRSCFQFQTAVLPVLCVLFPVQLSFVVNLLNIFLLCLPNFDLTLLLRFHLQRLRWSRGSVLAKFAGSNPAEAVGFFREKKSSAPLPSEGK